MSMLSSQADELRGYALSVRNVALRTTSLCHEARRDLLDSAVRMEQAADTIISLRDRLQDAELGRGTCKNKAPRYLDFLCSECGFVHYLDDANCTGDGNEWEYCPKCGCEVER